MTSTVSAAGLMEPRHRYAWTAGCRTPDSIRTPVPGAPAELEAVLLRHPDVTDAAVIGPPDDEAGEVPAR